jgi:hypothetical protein
MRWVGHVERMERKREAWRGLVRSPEEKILLGRSMRILEDNIKLDT